MSNSFWSLLDLICLLPCQLIFRIVGLSHRFMVIKILSSLRSICGSTLSKSSASFFKSLSKIVCENKLPFCVDRRDIRA